MRQNIILQTDSYKLTHWRMLPGDVTRVYSYLEARPGGEYDATVFLGLQPLLREHLEGARVTMADVDDAESFAAAHFDSAAMFNRGGWEYIVRRHGGRLPLLIRAVPEGTVVAVSNVLMTVENTDRLVPWLTNAVESLLLKVWYPTTVATVSRALKEFLSDACRTTGCAPSTADYMLHDFGYRGVSSEESARAGGMAHLTSFVGSDTLEAMRYAREHYGAQMPAASVAASEHSVMTAGGPSEEHSIARRIIAAHEGHVLSLVADSYDYYAFVEAMIREKELVDRCRVHLVIRPDSPTARHPTPEALVLWTLDRLYETLSSTTTETGHRVLPYGVLWGDGLDPSCIRRIVDAAVAAGYAASNLVFGMGGGLLQKVNRDTNRFAFKCSAQERDGRWHDVMKRPLDKSKASKAGRLKLVRSDWLADGYGPMHRTIREDEGIGHRDCLESVFQDGVILRQTTWADVKRRASLGEVKLTRQPQAEPATA